MMTLPIRWSVEARWGQGRLSVFEPTSAEIVAAAPMLADFYNDRYNAAMMTNTCEFDRDAVALLYRELQAAGDHPFLFHQDGQLIGDGDFRHTTGDDAEFAILIGPRRQQGRGLGTRCAIMMHGVAWRAWRLARVYAAVIPANHASRRLLETLGYRTDHSARAAAFADGDDAITMSLDMVEFAHAHAALLAEMTISVRGPSPV